MDCERTIMQIAAQVDQELPDADRAALQEHLASCASCAAVAEAFHLQDIDLRRGFAPLRANADSAGAKALAETRAFPAPAAPMPATTAGPWFRFVPLALAAAAVVAIVFSAAQKPGQEVAGPTPKQPTVAPQAVTPAGPGYLTAKPKTEAAAPMPLGLGETLATKQGERKRVGLPDGSVIYVNQNSVVKLDAERRLKLTAGEIYIEVAPRPDFPFVVTAQEREVRALGTRFSVRADEKGPSVLVTQGTVQVSGLSALLHAGQQLEPGGQDVSGAPRASHLLDWTRELFAAAESPLVPKSNHCGGDLIAIDPSGQEAKLSLRKVHVDVHIEDGFARTTIDQTYFNHLPQRLEGTFYFPLPPDASLSRLAMYVVDGNKCTLNEGGMAERNYARQVFEQIVTKMQDPALLEWVDGSTFKMRVFPLEGRQEKRIIMSYTQKLDSLYGSTNYRFPAGHNMSHVGEWSLYVKAKGAAKQAWKSATHKLTPRTQGDDLILEDRATDLKLDKDVQLAIADAPNRSAVRFSGAEHEGDRYLMLRMRPDLTDAKPQAGRKRTDWVFLFESSGDRDPVLARTQIDVLRTFLYNANHDDTFTILTAATRVGKIAEKQPATAENIKAAIDALEKVHLVGALDLGQAIAALQPYVKDASNPHVVHLGTGIAVLGERGEDVLAKRLPDNVPYVGVGVGKRWSRSFMKLAAERTGGAFTQINPDEEIGWRAFELFSLLRTPRLLGVKVVDNAEKVKFHSYTGAIAQGEEICAIARVVKGAEMPKTISVSGTLNGKPFAKEVAVKDVADKADYLPRTWAKLEIDHLLAENAEGNKPRIIELSKQMYVMTPFTSLLVLENEAMYQQFGVDRGRKDHWALYPCPPQIPIVHEPELRPAQVIQNVPAVVAPADGKLPVEQVLQSILVRVPVRLFHTRNQVYSGQTITAWQLLQVASAQDTDVLTMDPIVPQELLGKLDSYRSARGLVVRGSSRLHGNLNVERWGQLPADLPVWRYKQDGGPVGQTSAGSRAMDPGRHFAPPASIALPVIPMSRLEELGAANESKVKEQQEGFGPRGGRDLDLLERAGPMSYRRGMKDLDGRRRREQFEFGLDIPHLQSVDQYVQRMFMGRDYQTLIYQRPTFSGDDRLFSDLVAYAPGMSTTQADIWGVVEAEAQPTKGWEAGAIDAGAKKLIDAARAAGWRKVTVPGANGCTITFDGTGRHRWERELNVGMKELVVSDGKTLWHLYPDLGIGAKRPVSRFHRADFAEQVPFVVPAAEDLARGADVTLLGERLVRVAPRGAAAAKDKDGKLIPYAVTDYRFDADHRLVEMRRVLLPEDKVVSRETYDAAGTVRRFNREGKEVEVVKFALAEAEAPELTPTTTGLVVLPLPYRQRQHVYNVHKVNEYKKLSDEAALQLLASDFANWQNHEMLRLMAERYEGDLKSIGIYTLLAANGLSVDEQPGPGGTGLFNCQSALTKYADQPLARFLAYVSNPNRRQQSLKEAKFDLKAGTLPDRLAQFHELYHAWRNGRKPFGTEKNQVQQFAEVFAFVKANRSTPFAWAMLECVLSRGYYHQAQKAGITDTLKLFQDEGGLGYYVRYEIARHMLNINSTDSRARFVELYRQAFKEGALPVFDHALFQALAHSNSDGVNKNDWKDLMRETADSLFKDKDWRAVLTLVWQLQHVGDTALADELQTRILDEIPADQRVAATLGVIECYMNAGQPARADGLLQGLLDDPKQAASPALWRLAAVLAQRQQKLLRAVTCLETALEIEYRKLPEVINLQVLRQDFGALLSAYGTVAQMYQTLETKAPAEFTTRVVRLADRWRTLDPDATQACQSASVVLRAAGQKELAWDYLTTPLAAKPNEGATYLSLAQNLQSQQEIDLADKAYRLAYNIEPTNAQILWQHAQMLQTAGRSKDAHAVYQQLVDGKWQPRFQWLQQQARTMLGRQVNR